VRLPTTTIIFGSSAALLIWCQSSIPEALVVNARYHSGGVGYGGGSGYDTAAGMGYSAPSSSQEMLMPPVAWLYQDKDAAFRACPVLLGLCIAAAVGYVLQHYSAGLLPFQRLTVFYPPTLKAGEVWRLFTHVLLHGDLGHLFVNVLHVLNTLDLEAVPAGVGYPDRYSLGSRHVAGVAATAAAYGALVGCIPYWGAMFEGLSSLCFGLDGALLASCGLLLGSGSGGASLQSFLQVRGFYAALHMGMDVLRGCSSPGGTVGNFSHFAGFVAGACYVFAMLPDIGGRALPTIPCLTGSSGVWREDKCLAMFAAKYSWPVHQVQNVAIGILLTGALLALLNAFFGRGKASDASADGYSIFVRRASGGNRPGGASGDSALEAAMARSLHTHAAEQQRDRR